MKRILFLLLLLSSTLVYAQADLKQTDSASMVFVRIVEAEGKSGAQLFGLAKVALTDVYATPRSVIQTEDAVNGTIIAKAGFPYSYVARLHSYTGWVDYTLRIDVKEGRLRMAMYGFYHSYTGQNAQEYDNGGPLHNQRPLTGSLIFPAKDWERCIRTAYGEVSSVFISLQRGVLNSSNSDW